YSRLKGRTHPLYPVLDQRKKRELARRIDVREIVFHMEASASCIEDAHSIERRDPKFILPLNRLACGSNRDREASRRRRSLVSANIMKNVLGSPDASSAFQNADETRFTGTILSKD